MTFYSQILFRQRPFKVSVWALEILQIFLFNLAVVKYKKSYNVCDLRLLQDR